MHSPKTSPARLAFGGLVSLAVAMGIGRFVYTPILPLMAEGLHLTKSDAGFIASANFVGYLAGALATATPYLPGSARAWLIGGLVASALTTGLMAVVSAVAALAAVRFFGGLASAFVLVFASSSILSGLLRAGRAELASVLFAGVGVGIVLSSIEVSLLAAVGQSWRGMWFASGLLSLVGAGVAAATILPHRNFDSVEKASPPGLALHARLAALILAYGLFGFGYVITATFLVAIVAGVPELRPFAPYVWLLVGLSGIPSVWLWQRAAEPWGTFTAFAVACLIEASGVLASVLWPSGWGILEAALALGGTFMGITALGLNGARDLSVSDPRRVLAVMTAAFGIGQIAGPLAAGIAYDWTGSFLLPSLSAGLLLVIAAGLALWIGRHR